MQLEFNVSKPRGRPRGSSDKQPRKINILQHVNHGRKAYSQMQPESHPPPSLIDPQLGLWPPIPTSFILSDNISFELPTSSACTIKESILQPGDKTSVWSTTGIMDCADPFHFDWPYW